MDHFRVMLYWLHTACMMKFYSLAGHLFAVHFFCHRCKLHSG